MSEDDLFDYLKSGGSHFLSFADVPVVDQTATIGAALDMARSRGTRGVLARYGATQFRLVTVDAISAYQQAHSTQEEAVNARVGDVDQTEIPIVEMTEKLDRVYQDFSKVGLKVLIGSGRAVGLMSEAEEWESDFFQVPNVHICGNGHEWAPPPPSLCFCGSSIT